MGELDDAIREHLELKRRRGTDPAEVARMEHEALGPVVRGEPRALAHVQPDRGEAQGNVGVADEGDASLEAVESGAVPSIEHDDATQEYGVDESWLEEE